MKKEKWVAKWHPKMMASHEPQNVTLICVVTWSFILVYWLIHVNCIVFFQVSQTAWTKTDTITVEQATFISMTQVECTLPSSGGSYYISVSIDGGIPWSVGIIFLNYQIKCYTCHKDTGTCTRKVGPNLCGWMDV